jgi:hypothetical protein
MQRIARQVWFLGLLGLGIVSLFACAGLALYRIVKLTDTDNLSRSRV